MAKNMDPLIEKLMDDDSELFKLNPIPCAYTSLNGQFLKVNDSFCHLVGYSAQELKERTWMSITHPDDLEADRTMLEETIATDRTSYSMSKRYLTKMGGTVWCLLHAHEIVDPEIDPNLPRCFLMWAVPLPNHGKFKPIITQTEDDTEIHIRPVVKAGEFIIDNWKLFLPVITFSSPFIYKVIKAFILMMEKTGTSW